MNIPTKLIVSNSDMIRKYKSCRMKAESFGKIIIIKNNQPDAVLFSIAEYKKLSVLIESAEEFSEDEVQIAADYLTSEKRKKDHLI